MNSSKYVSDEPQLFCVIQRANTELRPKYLSSYIVGFFFIFWSFT